MINKKEKKNSKPMVNFDFDNIEEPELEKLPDISEILGIIKTVEIVPTGTPRKFSEQIRLVVQGGVSSLYVFDTVNNTWKSTLII